MKKAFLMIIIYLVTANSFAEMPFKRGVNLTGWLQTSGARQIQFRKFTRQDLENIKSLGCDVIRLPINLHAMTSGAPNYTIDPLFFDFLDRIVDWTEALGLHLILDNHTFDPAVNTDPNISAVLVPVWMQMAAHFKERSDLIYYEVLNEPHGIADEKWYVVQQNIITAIRSVDKKHTIIVGPAGWNSYHNLKYLPVYSDTNLIYTFHFYDPFLFTHQGASWTSPSLVPLTGVPFPYNSARMPACPPELANTWVKGSLDNYRNDGTERRVKELLDIAVAFKNQHKVPMLCGEFGVYIPNSANSDRVYWYNLVRSLLELNGIAWTTWDYTGGFGLFEPGSNELFDYDLNIPLIKALGLTAPPQKDFVSTPDSTGFDIYLDYIGPLILESGWTGGGILDFYSETSPVEGKYCIYWANAGQYSSIGFDFKPNKDLTQLVARGYAVDFWLRALAPNARIDVRFIDSKTTAPDDHPWRMRMTIDARLAQWDGQWHHLQIPLKSFTEHGSWDNGWFNPIGDFDWAAVDRFEIVAEHHDLQGLQFWIDNIRIVDPRIVTIGEPPQEAPREFQLLQNYPNPFNASTRIVFKLPKTAPVELVIYNTAGQTIRTLIQKELTPGDHAITWDGLDNAGKAVASGIYFYQLAGADFVRVRKMALVH